MKKSKSKVGAPEDIIKIYSTDAKALTKVVALTDGGERDRIFNGIEW